jgi:hypothetical protein
LIQTRPALRAERKRAGFSTRQIFLVFLCLVSSAALATPKKPPKTYSIPLPPQTDFSALDWLVGEWSGKTAERSPAGEVHLTVAYDLDKRFLVFREKMTLAATDSTPAVNESWMGFLSGSDSPNQFTLRVFSSTGFITRYRVTVQHAEIRFMPEGGEQPPPGWLFRRRLDHSNVDELTETVEAAPPDGSFFNYFSAKLTRQKATSPGPSPPGTSAVPKPKTAAQQKQK